MLFPFNFENITGWLFVNEYKSISVLATEHPLHFLLNFFTVSDSSSKSSEYRILHFFIDQSNFWTEAIIHMLVFVKSAVCPPLRVGGGPKISQTWGDRQLQLQGRPGQSIIWPVFPENCKKMRRNRPGGGHVSLRTPPPPNPPMTLQGFKSVTTQFSCVLFSFRTPS